MNAAARRREESSAWSRMGTAKGAWCAYAERAHPSGPACSKRRCCASGLAASERSARSSDSSRPSSCRGTVAGQTRWWVRQGICNARHRLWPTLRALPTANENGCCPHRRVRHCWTRAAAGRSQACLGVLPAGAPDPRPCPPTGRPPPAAAAAPRAGPGPPALRLLR